jgi:hypothetical protein
VTQRHSHEGAADLDKSAGEAAPIGTACRVDRVGAVNATGL